MSSKQHHVMRYKRVKCDNDCERTTKDAHMLLDHMEE